MVNIFGHVCNARAQRNIWHFQLNLRLVPWDISRASVPKEFREARQREEEPLRWSYTLPLCLWQGNIDFCGNATDLEEEISQGQDLQGLSQLLIASYAIMKANFIHNSCMCSWMGFTFLLLSYINQFCVIYPVALYSINWKGTFS